MILLEEYLDEPLTLIRLCHNRWGIPILAELQRSQGGMKFITIQSRLGLSRDALSRTLAALCDLDLVLRNPGYGHPLRPEFLMTPSGEDGGPACLALWDQIIGNGQEDTTGRKWSLPVVWGLCFGAERYSELQRCLQGVTPRALTNALRDLENAGLVNREVTNDRPPGVRYSLTSDGEGLSTYVDDLASALEFGR